MWIKLPFSAALRCCGMSKWDQYESPLVTTTKYRIMGNSPLTNTKDRCWFPWIKRCEAFSLFLFLHKVWMTTVLFPLPPLGLAKAIPYRRIISFIWMNLPPSLGQSPTSHGCFSQIQSWPWRFTLALAAHISLGWWARGSGQEPEMPSWPSGTGYWNPRRQELLGVLWSLAYFAVGSGPFLFLFCQLLLSLCCSNHHSI